MADKVKLEYSSGGGDFAPHSEGTHAMVVVDAIDMGFRIKDYPGTPASVQPFMAVVWASGERNTKGELITVSRYYSNSMHKKAALRQALEAMRGKSYTDEQAAKAARDPDLFSKLEGFPCLVTVEHKASDDGDRTWGRVTNLSPLPKALPSPVSACADYVRGDYWEERKTKYLEEVKKFQGDGPPAVGLDEMPPELEQPSDDLPF